MLVASKNQEKTIKVLSTKTQMVWLLKKQLFEHPFTKVATVLSDCNRPTSNLGKQLHRWTDHFSSLHDKDVSMNQEAFVHCR